MKLNLNPRLIYFRFLLLLIVLMLVLTTACNSLIGQGNQNSTEQLIVYTSIPEAQARGYLEGFEKEYPDIEVNLIRESIANLRKRLLNEKEVPQADVIWGLTATNLLLLEWQDMLKAYAPKGVEDVDERFKDPALPPHWVGINLIMSVFCVNPEVIQKENLRLPESWQDLLHSDYADHIVMASPLTTGTGYIIISSILDSQGDVLGWDFFDKLHRNIDFYSNSAATACELVGEGKYAIGLSADARAAIEINAGNPVIPIFPSEGTSWDVRANALLKKKEIKSAALTFMDWAISGDAMQAYAKDTAVISVDLELPVPNGYPADIGQQLIDIDFPWAAANNKNILAEWEERYGEKLEPQE